MNHLRLMFAVALLTVMNVTHAELFQAKSGPHVTPVLELYTSEGCSSCPPADRWLAELVNLPRTELDVLALAFHVDYWDYIGWKDEFADPRFTQRQRALAVANRQQTIYTPGFFVDGVEARGTRSIIDRIRTANQTPAPIDLELELQRSGERIDLQLSHAATGTNRFKVQFIVFEDQLSNQVQAGENAGRKLDHQRVVRYLSQDLPLVNTAQHQIELDEQWDAANLGVAAIVRNHQDEYLQSVQFVW